MASTPEERMERLRIKAWQEAQREHARAVRSAARWQAARDMGASAFQAGAYNPLMSQAMIGVLGAAIATFGKVTTRAINFIPESQRVQRMNDGLLKRFLVQGVAENPFELVGGGMITLAGAGATAETISNLVQAFRPASEAKAVTFDLGSPGFSGAMASAGPPPDFPVGPGPSGRGAAGSLAPFSPVAIPAALVAGAAIGEMIPQGQTAPQDVGQPTGEGVPRMVPVQQADGSVVLMPDWWVAQMMPEGAQVPAGAALVAPQGEAPQRAAGRAPRRSAGRFGGDADNEPELKVPQVRPDVVVGVERGPPEPAFPPPGAVSPSGVIVGGGPTGTASRDIGLQQSFDVASRFLPIGVAPKFMGLYRTQAGARALGAVGPGAAGRTADGRLNPLGERYARQGGVSPAEARFPRPIPQKGPRAARDFNRSNPRARPKGPQP